MAPANDQALRVLQAVRERLPELRSRYSVRAIWLFGSLARGESTERSDVDLLVEFDAVPDLLDFVSLRDELSAALGVPVDLVMKRALRPALGRRVLAEAIAI